MKLVITGLVAGFLIGILCMGFFLFSRIPGMADVRWHFYNGIGLGIGIGFSATLALALINWFIGVVDRIKSGRVGNGDG